MKCTTRNNFRKLQVSPNCLEEQTTETSTFSPQTRVLQLLQESTYTKNVSSERAGHQERYLGEDRKPNICH